MPRPNRDRSGGSGHPPDTILRALRVAAIYLVVGLVWIAFSDALVHATITDPDTLLTVETLKGWFFVVASAVLIYLLVARELRGRKREADRFWALAAQVPTTITVLDADGTVRYTSAAVEALTGYTPHEREGRGIFDTVHPDQLEEARAVLARVRDTPGARETLDVRILHRGGEERVAEVTVRNLLDDPAVGGIVINAHDVTARRSLEAQLLQAQKMEAIGRLAGGVAHDFNNVLTVILGSAHELLAPGADAGHVDAQAREIIQSAERGALLTKQMLAFSRQRPTELEAVDLNRSLGQLRHFLGRLLPANVQLVVNPDDRVGLVHAPPGAIEQIVMNLAVNAGDAMPDGGTFTIETANRELDATYAREHPEVRPGSYAMIALTDTGSGIPEDVRQRIFEPFYTTKPEGVGTGLGLSIVYGLSKQCGGHVSVYSEPGHGTTFRVYLPHAGATGTVAPAGPAAGPAAGEHRPLAVMVVEDEDVLRSMIVRTLQGADWQVVAAATAAEALELADGLERGLDVVVTDIGLPDLDGWTLAERLRERRDCRFLFMSGFGVSSFPADRVAQAAFIEKPFTPGELLARVRDVGGG